MAKGHLEALPFLMDTVVVAELLGGHLPRLYCTMCVRSMIVVQQS